jgi:hypothetical protein
MIIQVPCLWSAASSQLAMSASQTGLAQPSIPGTPSCRQTVSVNFKKPAASLLVKPQASASGLPRLRNALGIPFGSVLNQPTKLLKSLSTGSGNAFCKSGRQR